MQGTNKKFDELLQRERFFESCARDHLGNWQTRQSADYTSGSGSVITFPEGYLFDPNDPDDEEILVFLEKRYKKHEILDPHASFIPDRLKEDFFGKD